MFVPLYSCIAKIFIHYWLTSGKYSCTFTQVFMPYWNVECNPALGKSGRWFGPRSCIILNHLRLNQPPINFFPKLSILHGRSGFEAGSKCYSRQGILPRAPRGFFILPFWAASSRYFFFFHFPLHCLDSMNEHLGRIINYAFS